MKIFTFILSASNKVEKLRRNEGDIVDIKEGIIPIGKKERKHFFAVPVGLEDDFSLENLEILRQPVMNEDEVIMKKRFKIDFEDIRIKALEKGIDLDLSKIRDEKQDYQNILDGSVVLDLKLEVFDKVLGRKLSDKELKEPFNLSGE